MNNIPEEKLYDTNSKFITYIPVNLLSDKERNGYYNRKMHSWISSTVSIRADEDSFYSVLGILPSLTKAYYPIIHE